MTASRWNRPSATEINSSTSGKAGAVHPKTSVGPRGLTCERFIFKPGMSFSSTETAFKMEGQNWTVPNIAMVLSSRDLLCEFGYGTSSDFFSAKKFVFTVSTKCVTSILISTKTYMVRQVDWSTGTRQLCPKWMRKSTPTAVAVRSSIQHAPKFTSPKIVQ